MTDEKIASVAVAPMAFDEPSACFTNPYPVDILTKSAPSWYKYCYVYRQDEMYGSENATSVCQKNAA